jgi:sigma-B regulation protein RsbU (phosphoserine phosphatase)
MPESTDSTLRRGRDVSRRAAEGLRRIASSARCLLWYGEVEDPGDGSLNWKIEVADEEAAQRFFPLEVPPECTYIRALGDARLPTDRARMGVYGDAEAKAGRDYRQEYRVRNHQGEVRWLVEDVHLEPVGPGRWRVVGVTTDITERKRAEAENAFLAAAVASSPDAIIATTLEGVISGWNAGAQVLYGWGVEESLGRPFDEVVAPPERSGELRRDLRRLASGAAPDVAFEAAHVRKDGSPVEVSVRVGVVRDPHTGQPIGLCSIARDVTERRRAERELQARAEREALLGRVGHALLASGDPDAVQGAITAALGAALGADHCYLCLYDGATGAVTVGPDWCLPGLPSLSGVYRHSDLDPGDLYPGQAPLVLEDVRDLPGRAAAALEALGLRSAVSVGLFEEGGLVASLNAAMAREPRAWTPEEVELVQAVAARTRAAVESARLRKREHDIAERLQAALQPALPGRVPGLDLAEHYRPALREANIGGDFYDVFAVEKGCYALIVADLSGKGLAAAAQIATVRHMLRTLLYRRGTTVAQAVTSLNEMLEEHGLLPGFATLFVGAYDVNARTLTYVNAGQEPGLLLRAADGTIEELGPTGPVLGGFGGAEFSEAAVSLTPGDVLALFTDGLTEAGASRNSLLGVPVVAEIFVASVQERDGSAQEITARLMAGVEEVTTPAGIRDDVCLLVARVEDGGV